MSPYRGYFYRGYYYRGYLFGVLSGLRRVFSVGVAAVARAVGIAPTSAKVAASAPNRAVSAAKESGGVVSVAPPARKIAHPGR